METNTNCPKLIAITVWGNCSNINIQAFKNW
jgi:hypothetical protein